MTVEFRRDPNKKSVVHVITDDPDYLLKKFLAGESPWPWLRLVTVDGERIEDGPARQL